ncbi:hypothetical protein NQZ68_038795 [Dissostichus eleginoides]|nr:hypothetical protein NQZ68_038795 [Dissostichus eleginoides]
MDDFDQYPVFFECQSLLQDQVKKIENYFRVRRRSGGGDCGSLRKVSGSLRKVTDQIYSISFKNQKDQQAVLKKSVHDVEDLVLTVRDGLELHTSSPNKSITAPVQSPQSIPVSIPPSSGEKYELQQNTSLLRYLKECPTAWKRLEKDLASLSCSAQLYPEEGRVLVSFSTQPDDENDIRDWKAEVDKLFDGYLCHCEVDPHKVVAFFESRNSLQTTNDVKVYSENGMAIVGQCSQVNAKLMDVDALLGKQGLRPSLDSLVQDRLPIDNRVEVKHRASTENRAPSDLGFQMDASAQDGARGATAGAPGGGVHLEIIQGTIETQQVDALVSPMVGHDPLSTRVGNTLFQHFGNQLTARFRKEADEETIPGDTVLVEALAGLQSNAVIFLNLAPWNEDPDGAAVGVLRMGINNILTSCENRGFGSVALPVLGTGIALRFPDSLVARVVLEEVYAFEKNRASAKPLLVRIVIHPEDEDSLEAFKSAQEAFQLKGFTMRMNQHEQDASQGSYSGAQARESLVPTAAQSLLQPTMASPRQEGPSVTAQRVLATRGTVRPPAADIKNTASQI